MEGHIDLCASSEPINIFRVLACYAHAFLPTFFVFFIEIVGVVLFLFLLLLVLSFSIINEQSTRIVTISE